MTKPGDAAMQRTTYSQYYKENCAKGGVFLQFCGWMGTASLWTGGVGDSEYQTDGTIISDQKDFAQKDCRANGEFNPFIMLLDKGYCIMEIAYREGDGQITLQPDFAKSDQRFKRHEALSSAAVGTDRSGNERAVHLSKQCGLIKNGIKSRTCYKRIDDVWLTWSF